VTLCHHLSRRNGQHRRIRDLTGRRLCGVRRRTALRHCRLQIVGRKRANDPQVDVRDLTRALESLPTIRGGAKFKEIVPPTLCEATNNRSKTFARHVCATVIAVFTSRYVVKAGTSTRRGHVAFIASWVCNCATKRRNAGLRQSYARKQIIVAEPLVSMASCTLGVPLLGGAV
jgi:hypothetical protein